MNGMQNWRVDFPDQELQFRVKSFLSSRHFPGFEMLEVSARNGAVTLSGKVDSFYEKQIAISSCQRVAGVLELIDRIKVSVRSDRVKPVFTGTGLDGT